MLQARRPDSGSRRRRCRYHDYKKGQDDVEKHTLLTTSQFSIPCNFIRCESAGPPQQEDRTERRLWCLGFVLSLLIPAPLGPVLVTFFATIPQTIFVALVLPIEGDISHSGNRWEPFCMQLIAASLHSI